MDSRLDLTTIQDITDDFVKSLKLKLDSNGTNASNDLKNSIRGIVQQNGKFIVISIELEDYWKYVEYGTKPHFPPLSAIKRWISVKPVLPRPLPSGKLPTENQLSYLIARKISKVGTKPQPFLKTTINDFNLIGKVYNEVTELINKQIKDLEV